MGGPWEEYATALVDKKPWEEYAAKSTNSPADYPQYTGGKTPEAARREFVRQEKGNASLVERLPDVVQDAIPSRQTLASLARPTLEAGGAIGGGLIGGASGALAGLGLGAIPGTVAGASLGYASGSNLANVIEGNNPATLADSAKRTLKDIGTGAMYEMGGQAAVPILSGVAKGVGAVAKPILGRLSGTGTGAVEEALKSGMQPVLNTPAPVGEKLVDKAARWAKNLNPLTSETAYDKALRGKISGEEIVDSARNALVQIKDARGAAYQSKLAEVEAVTGKLNIQPISDKVYDLAARYNVKIDPVTLKVDTSRVAMGKTGRKDIEDIFDTLVSWGKDPKDMTPTGLDTLKRQLDDFYSDSSQARQFVSSLRDTVRKTIVDQVPAYGEMTKGYSEATKIIKDIEADLMLRKQGMSGRVTADKTLRRLMSSMRDNFELRKDLVDILGKKGDADLSGMIAGYSQSAVLPRGLAGVAPTLTGGAAIAHFVDPWFASVLVASSPRVQGEFLRMWGKGMKGVKAIGPQGQKAILQGSAIASENAGQ